VRDSVSPPDLEDSDEDSNVSPPPPSSLHQGRVGSRGRGRRDVGLGHGMELLKLPTRWSQEVRHSSLSVSGDGRELTFNGAYASLPYCDILLTFGIQDHRAVATKTLLLLGLTTPFHLHVAYSITKSRSSVKGKRGEHAYLSVYLSF
jgi:hypothetical protein